MKKKKVKAIRQNEIGAQIKKYVHSPSVFIFVCMCVCCTYYYENCIFLTHECIFHKIFFKLFFCCPVTNGNTKILSSITFYIHTVTNQLTSASFGKSTLGKHNETNFSNSQKLLQGIKSKLNRNQLN